MAPFITFEGIEGSGKTTQIRLLADRLTQQNYSVVQTREPGGCPISDQIRSILLNPRNVRMDSRTELFLYAAARAQHIEQIVRPALATGQVVLCDRFTDATLAYQGDGRGLDRRLIQQLNQLAANAISPDLTLLFDLPVEIGLGRARQRETELQDSSEGRFERETLEFHQRIRAGYLALAEAEPQRVKIVDASASPENVSQQVTKIIATYFDSLAEAL
jgi:dTMP kinase